MKRNKSFAGVCYGPDEDIKNYPRAVERRGKCGYGYNCGTCRFRIESTDDNAPCRCMEGNYGKEN